MIIAQAQDLEQRFGGNTIFSNISFSVPDNARIGLVASKNLLVVNLPLIRDLKSAISPRKMP